MKKVHNLTKLDVAFNPPPREKEYRLRLFFSSMFIYALCLRIIEYLKCNSVARYMFIGVYNNSSTHRVSTSITNIVGWVGSVVDDPFCLVSFVRSVGSVSVKVFFFVSVY